MKILLITYYYKHKNAMASVRAIKLAKYFSMQGHEVTVLTSNQIDTWTKSYLEPEKDDKIVEIYAPQIKRWENIQKFLEKRRQKGLEKLQRKNEAKNTEQETNTPPDKKSWTSIIKAYLSWLFYFNIAKQEDICMFEGLKKEFEQSLRTKFDVAIATYPNYGAFMMGMWLKKKGYCKQLIADFRDPLYNPGFRDRKEEANYDKNCLKNIIESADKFVCVSQGIAEGIRELYPKMNKPIRVITNGFDYDDVENSNSNACFEKKKINFFYAGALYHGKRCVDMLAIVLQELIREGKISKNSFAFHYAGSDYAEMLAQLKKYGLEETAVDHNFVSREESIAMQKNASALLLLTWNEITYKGVIPGKLFEYMAVKVPIIALITGDVANSEVALMIRKTNAGFAAEEIVEQDKIALKQYVEKLFQNEIKQSSETELYNYKNISKEYINFLKEI